MKASELINQIVELAELKFKVNSLHNNDAISVLVYPCRAGGFTSWQAMLMRPTKKELDEREISNEELDNSKTIMKYEYESHCYVEGLTMMDTLWKLFHLLDSVTMDNGHAVPRY